MPRHNFSQATKKAAKMRAGGYCEAEGEVYGLEPGQRCNAILKGKRVEIDHYPIPATDKGSDALENAVTCCVDCHSHKSENYDIPMQAKGKRLALRAEGIRPPSKWRASPRQKAPPQRTATRELSKRVGYFGEQP